MPSPFPGMDPYLEYPDIFGNLHHDFIVCLKEQLQPKLPEPYYARSQYRSWIDGPNDGWREAYGEICTRRGRDRRIVTSIEVLSPTNKGRSRKGHELYLQKQQELMDAEVHLVEIDLLRGGTHTTAVPLDRLRQRAPKYQYHVCIHRFDRWEEFILYPFGIHDRLPTIEIPLLPEDGSVKVDLQAVFSRCYDVGPYRHEVDYLKDEVLPPLSREDAHWAQDVIEAALRTSSKEGESR